MYVYKFFIFYFRIIPKGKLQHVDSGLKLFQLLEYHHRINPRESDFDVIIEVLYRVHRLDLVKKLGARPKDVKVKYQSDIANTKLIPFRLV